ncbi:MAG TPA: hypothetical protein VFY92_00850 [Hyphomicrobiaceae bacterium]|nr:hypothetical protein [Hyphomicrobiaceae bacterium]
MPSYREIVEIQKDPARARALAQGLSKLGDAEWTDWELDFLASIGARRRELTTRQGEKLIELRDDAIWYTAVDGFSLKALIERCHLLRDELAERDAAFIERLHAEGATMLRRKAACWLMACARAVGEIEPHQGRSFERLSDAGPVADDEA